MSDTQRRPARSRSRWRQWCGCARCNRASSFSQALQVRVEYRDPPPPRPTAIATALVPANAAAQYDKILMSAGSVPGTPGTSSPGPPCGRSIALAPTMGASRPATSLMGASRGRAREGSLHRLVGDPRHAAGEQSARELFLGGQVQVGEEHESVAEVRVLGGDGLFDLEQQLRLAPGRRCVGHDARALLDVGLVCDGGPQPCAGLHEHFRDRGSPGREPPAGVMATRYSLFLTSAGTAILISSPRDESQDAAGAREPRTPRCAASTIVSGTDDGFRTHLCRYVLIS